MVLITIFGSCRQQSIYGIPEAKVTGIRDNITYTHYTKEVLELIKYCKYGHLSPEQTITTFRTPILQNRKLYYNNILINNFNNTNVFFIEIASRVSYEYNGVYIHHILSSNEELKNNIIIKNQNNEEIENDIIEIKNQLNRPIIIVGHIVTYNYGKRYELLKLLETVCLKHNILFINPFKEIYMRNYNIKNLLEDDLTHYNFEGHSVMKNIYLDFLKKI
jgi:hypothetical protein